MEMYLDYKATVWFRIPVGSKEMLEKVIQKIKDENLTPSELYDEEGLELCQCEPLYETETFLTPEDNDDYPTIEAFEYQDVDGSIQPVNIWNNIPEKEVGWYA